MSKIKFLLLIASLVIFVGCGGGGGASSESSDTVSSDTNTSSNNQTNGDENQTNNNSTQTSTKAVLGVQGYGSKSIGGRGGIVYKVTNLEWNDTNGSLKYGLYGLKVPRIIVFDVSGVINIPEYATEYLTYENSYVTVAGQTSEGGITLSMSGEGSIALRSYNMTETTPPVPLAKSKQFHDAIFQNIRFRGTNNSDNLSFAGVYNIAIDHCDFSGATDEALDITFAEDLTVQNTTITNTMGNYGFLLAYKPTTNISLHHNLTANLTDRCLAHIHWEVSGTPDGGAKIDIRNNVGYNCWHESFVPTSLKANDVLDINFINNYFIVGPNSSGPGKEHSTTGMISFWYEGGYSNQIANLYASGNLFPDSDTTNFPSGQRPLLPYSDSHVNLSTVAYSSPEVTTLSADEAKANVMAYAGAWPRDAMNKRVINEINTKTGSLRNIGDVLLTDNPTPPTDSDNDGMADSWESENGLSVGSNDSALDVDNDGYTNIEEYLQYKMQSLIGK